MNKQTRIKSTMRTRIALLCIAGLLASSFAQAGAVDQSGFNIFEANTPARADQVNANFQALITAIDDNASSDAVTVDVACADPADLQDAIDGSDPTKPLAITLGTTAPCGPVAITRDNVSITNGTIQTDSQSQTPVLIEGARHIVLSNVTIDGQNLAEAGLVVGKGSLASVNGVTVSGTTAEAVNVFVQSSLVLGGTNTFDGGSEVGLNIGGNATVFAESGLTTISSTGGACVLEMDANAVLGGSASAELNISGSCVEISGNSFLGLEVGSIDLTGKLVVRMSMVSIETEDDVLPGVDFTLNALEIDAAAGSRVLVVSKGTATIESTGRWAIGGDASAAIIGSGTSVARGGDSITASFGGTFSAGEGADLSNAANITARWNGQVIMGTGMLALPTTIPIQVYDRGTYISLDSNYQDAAQVSCSRPLGWPAVTKSVTTDSATDAVTLTVSDGFAVAIPGGTGGGFADLCQ